MRSRFVFLAVIAVVTGATLAWAYSLQWVNPGIGLPYFEKWANNTTITMVYNLTMPSQFSANAPNPALVQAVLRNDMLNVWNGVLKSNNIPIQFADGGTSTVTDSACDGVNLITFANKSTTYPPPPNGVLALTYVQAIQSPGLLGAGSCGPNAINTTFAGQILDTDITFNVTVPFSVDGRLIPGSGGCFSSNSTQACDIEGTALHELGHVLGLHHSTLDSSLMIVASQQLFPSRSINSDDIAGINAAYGVNNLGGSISGTVTNGLGVPVYGAAVQLTNATTGQPTVSGISDITGAYSMVGFAPGTYNIWVKPLDAPFTPGNYTAEYNSAPSAAFNAQSVSGQAVVTGKANLTFPIQVTSPHTATFNYVGVITATTSFTNTSYNLVESVRRAGTGSGYPSNTGTYGICAYGTNLTGSITTSSPTAQYTGATNSSTCNGSGALFQQSMTFPANSVPGFYDVYMGNDFLPSTLSITTNPLVGAGGVVDSAANTTTYAAGSFVSIYGLDLTTQTVGNTVFPVPTQLAGVSVRVGDRFAPLFFVSPGQVNAMIPYEATSCSTGATTGCLVDVQVQVGVNSMYDYGNINVVASAPKIFTINATGTGQGAIQDGSAPACQTSSGCPIADGNHYTASAGDILVIYASGLGQTTPAAIDGLSGSGTVALPTVSFTANGSTKVATAVYAGATSCCSALYQVNVAVPGGLGAGNANVNVTVGNGNTSNTVTVAIK